MPLSHLLHDLRYTLRQLRRAPGFALGVVLVLALGIGANAGMFTVLEATLFRPLPYTHPGDLVSFSVTDSTGKPSSQHLADVLAWRERSRSLAGLAYFDIAPAYLSLDAQQGVPHQVLSVSASANLFSTLGVVPARGRAFTPEEQQPGRGAVAILSDVVWRTRFHADPDVLGRTIRLDDTPTTIIGIMPSGFIFPADAPAAQVWRPVSLAPAALARSVFEAPSFSTIARRRPGVSMATIATELTSLQRGFIALYAGSADIKLAPAHVIATRYRETLSASGQRSALLALLAAVLVLWLIACSNVAGLMLARSAAHRRELAVRSALGATRSRLIQQRLVESLLLSFVGGLFGLILSELTLALFRHRLTAQLGAKFRGGIGTELPLHPDARVLCALGALSLLSALLFSLIPSLTTSRASIDQGLRQSSAQAGTGRGQHTLQRGLIVAELALTLGLLVSCGLLLRSVLALRQVPLGFRVENVYVLRPNLPGYKYAQLDPNITVYKPLLARLQSLPGIQSSAITTVAPLDKSFRVNFSLVMDGKRTRPKAAGQALSAQMRAAGPELQQVLGFRMLRGRYFNASDTPGSPRVIVVNQAFANLYNASGEDIDHFTLRMNGDGFKVIGIVDDFRQKSVADPAEPEVDLDAAQLQPTDGFYQPTLKMHAQILLRSTRDPASLIPELRRVLQQTDPDLVSTGITTMAQVVDDSMGSQLLAAHLLETLGALALLISAAGLYSLLAYLVTLRTRELGLRLALGAQRLQIQLLVLRGAGTLLLTGIVAGLALSFVAVYVLRAFLFGVGPHDPFTLLSATMLLLLVGLAGAWIPAHRASSVSPTEALRAE